MRRFNIDVGGPKRDREELFGGKTLLEGRVVPVHHQHPEHHRNTRAGLSGQLSSPEKGHEARSHYTKPGFTSHFSCAVIAMPGAEEAASCKARPCAHNMNPGAEATACGGIGGPPPHRVARREEQPRVRGKQSFSPAWWTTWRHVRRARGGAARVDPVV